MQDQLAAATPADQASLGLRTTEIAGALVMAADGLDSLIQNRVLGLGLHEPMDAAALEAVLAHYAPGRSFAIIRCPFAEPASADALLRQHGFATFFHHLKWVRDDSPVIAAPTSLDVVAIEPARANEWESLYCSIHDLVPAFAAWSARCAGRAGWSYYLALDRGRAVAAAAMFVDGDLAWLGKAGTIESDRGRGAQSALLSARVRDGLGTGVRTFAMETGPDWPDRPRGSLRNAARAGFRPAYERPSWVHGLVP